MSDVSSFSFATVLWSSVCPLMGRRRGTTRPVGHNAAVRLPGKTQESRLIWRPASAAISRERSLFL